ncbi:MAG TPA: NUDIX domain-containing protein [Coleofasciculaceae cyanobacterium]
MKDVSRQQQWKTLARFVEIRSSWMTLIGEHLQDDRQQVLDYWRVEKADAVIVLTIQDGKLLFPILNYRPGLGEPTLDFPGGRVSAEQTPEMAARRILDKELGLTEEAIANLTPLNSTGWAVNSSFSNQKLYGFVAEISPMVSLNPDLLGATYPATETGIRTLLKDLTCLQCRAVLLEWQSQLT